MIMRQIAGFYPLKIENKFKYKAIALVTYQTKQKKYHRFLKEKKLYHGTLQ
jgi:hypothetical protein